MSEAIAQASLIIAAGGIIVAVVFFIVKAVVGHVIVTWGARKLNARKKEEKRDGD